eukprot:CAMPEP_0201524486 /NCGR_PEP_ID=MMETSP0161_2-20130828/22675_1 /ASSEMBLY_ACC=CAM_ASM_000251 /TAXON_ID=180227 /ORGANISM="Neoparamoeba aestuarina, Strain SoJaBio B1-5/56/2" /LENGTH=250 /DNA_ID=CAMNT_0047923905 /DNA_START=54 /DNA_END=806 /DNA_ORIENTATION=+
MEKKAETNQHLVEIQEALKSGASARQVFACPFDDEAGKEKIKAKSSQVKYIAFVRHGQGEHNLAAHDIGRHIYLLPEYTDAKLTELGKSQASELRPFADTLKIEKVFVSPLCRALETATLAFGTSTPYYCVEEIREQYGKHFCDKRRNVSVLKEEFGHVDFSSLSDADPWFTEERETKAHVISRTDKVLNDFLMKDEKERLALVGHSSFLLSLFNSALDGSLCSEAPDFERWFKPGELRYFVVGVPKADS